MASGKLKLWEGLLYALPWNAYAFIMLPLGIVLPTYYAEATLASATSIGFVSGIARIFDAVTDPLIGYASDRTRSRWGKRKPWIVVGSVVTCVAILFLFRPPHDAGIAYYAFASFALYVGYALFDIPHKAWFSEVTVDYADRSRIASYVAIFTVLGSILFWVVPLALSPWTHTTAIGPESFDAIAWLFVLVLPLSIAGAVTAVPAGQPLASQSPDLKSLARSIRRNRLFWRYLSAAAIWGLGQGMSFSVVFLVMRDYLGLGERFGILMIAFFVIQFASMPVWARIMNRWGKHRAWAFSWGFGALWSLLLLAFAPGSAPFWPMLGLMSVSAFVNAASYIAPRAVLGDIVDYDILVSRQNSSGNYFAFNTLLDKALIGVGVGLAFPLIGAFGYQIGGHNDALATFGLLFCYLGVPLVTHSTAAAILWNFPLDARRHAIVRARIEQRARRASAHGVATAAT